MEIYNQLILNQNANYAKVETFVVTAISVAAINEYNAHGQQESFLGLSAEQIYFVESQINNSLYYYVDGETGELRVLEVPKDPPEGVDWWNVLSWVLAVAQIVIGVVLIVTAIVGMVASYGIATPVGIFQIVNGLAMISGGIAIHSGKNSISQQYTTEWRNFFNTTPNATKQQVVDFGKIMWDFFKR